MGKSNKFDYTNRPNSGVKLGQIIASALEKEVIKTAQDAEKQASKVRKDSADVAKDGTVTVHLLDIKVPGKQLGDDGVLAMATGLEAALLRATSQASLVLVDLNLSGNAITTLSLARLASIIDLARDDVKILDLSKNNICVQTNEEAHQWQAFLRAVQLCSKLRRLDLGGNRSLGARALEILARLHIREIRVQTMSGDVQHPFHAKADGLIEEDNTETDSTSGGDESGHVQLPKSGLRSLPYLVLTETGLDDAGALWLSYVVEDHPFPSQLIDERNPVVPNPAGSVHQSDGRSNGIEWTGQGVSLTRDGLYVLNKAEQIRRRSVIDDRASIGQAPEHIDGSDAGDGHNSEDADNSRISKKQTPRRQRRTSTKSSTVPDDDHDKTELHSARKKVERSIIVQSNGVSTVELWRCALRVTVAARLVSGIGPIPRGRYFIGAPIFDYENYKPQDISLGLPAPLVESTNGQIRVASSTKQDPPRTPLKSGTYAAKLSADPDIVPGEPETCISSASNSPETPRMTLLRPAAHHRKNAFSENSDLLAATTQQQQQQLARVAVAVAVVRDHRRPHPQRFVTWQQERIASTPDGPRAFRDPAVPSHLPRALVAAVVRQVLLPPERDLLSPPQWAAAFQWGVRRENVKTEQEWRRLADSAQALTLLERIGCAAYDDEQMQ